jgi:hypothetical protein
MLTNFSGRWIADLAKSRFAALRPAALNADIHHHEPELRQELLVIKPDGSEVRAILECRTSGEESRCVLNGNVVRGHARWVNDELVIETWPAFGHGQTYFCDCWSLSADGQTLVMEHRKDALSGQRVVFERAS